MKIPMLNYVEIHTSSLSALTIFANDKCFNYAEELISRGFLSELPSSDSQKLIPADARVFKITDEGKKYFEEQKINLNLLANKYIKTWLTYSGSHRDPNRAVDMEIIKDTYNDDKSIKYTVVKVSGLMHKKDLLFSEIVWEGPLSIWCETIAQVAKDAEQITNQTDSNESQ